MTMTTEKWENGGEKNKHFERIIYNIYTTIYIIIYCCYLFFFWCNYNKQYYLSIYNMSVIYLYITDSNKAYNGHNGLLGLLKTF